MYVLQLYLGDTGVFGRIRAGNMRRMLYFVQDSTAKSGWSKNSCGSRGWDFKKSPYHQRLKLIVELRLYPDIIKLKLYNGEEEQG